MGDSTTDQPMQVVLTMLRRLITLLQEGPPPHRDISSGDGQNTRNAISLHSIIASLCALCPCNEVLSRGAAIMRTSRVERESKKRIR